MRHKHFSSKTEKGVILYGIAHTFTFEISLRSDVWT